jgi:hypothetical protein
MKKKEKGFLVFLCLFLLLGFLAHAQTTEIRGKITSPEGEVLPGVEVILSSPNLIGGNQVKLTDAEGKYRFFALLPGIYAVEAKLQGFVPQRQADLRLSAGRTLTADFVLEIGRLEEEVAVIAKAPIIDVKDSQTVTTTLKTEFLQKLPNRSVEGALDFAPGVYDRSAFGSPVSNSNSYKVDGVPVNDPEAGENAFGPEYDSIEEISVMGVGAPAEYDGYSGAVVDTVMKSGGNDFHGTLNLFMRLPSFHSQNWDNYPYLIRKGWPESYEGNFNLGGRIIKDKLWFFTSAQYSYSKDHIEDFKGLTESWKGQRLAGKLTWQANKKDRFSVWMEALPSKIINYGTNPLMAPGANTNEPHMDFYYNSNILHMFSDKTFLEVKFGGFYKKGHNEVDKNGPPAHLELTNDYLTGNYPVTYNAHASRFQANATLSHFAEDFIKGSHDFKFGAEVEASKVYISYFYPGGKYYLDYQGENYILDEWDGEEANPSYRKISAFAQDSWEVTDRLTINPGIRINLWRGYIPGVSGAVFAPKMGIAPRLGITFDLLGDNSTILKAHYGKYYHGLMVQFFMRLQPQGGFREFIWGPTYDEFYELPEGTHGEEWVLDWEDVWQNEYTVDPNLKMAYMNQYVIGIERELGKDVSAGASFIYRTNHDLQDRVNITGQWEPTTWTSDYPGPDFGKTYSVYARLNPGENQFYLTNPKAGVDYGAAFPGIVPFTPSMNYRGLQFTFEKRYSKGWMLSASYTWGKAWGTSDNTWGEWGENRSSMLGASTLFSNPNYQINAEGRLGIDPTHMVKIYGAVDIPVVGVTLGVYYNFASGVPYNSNVALPRDIDSDPVSHADFTYIYGDEKGHYRYPGMHNLDIRLEKFFKIGKTRVSALADIFNVFNTNTITDYETQMNPASEYQFGYVWGIKSPRTFRLGFRFVF